MHKTCTRCNETQPLLNYYPDKRAKDGKQPSCKICQAKMAKDYYHANRDMCIKKNKDRAEKHPHKAIERHFKYRIENIEKVKSGYAEWYAKNRDYHILYNIKNRSYLRLKAAEWRKKNPEKVRIAVENRRAKRLSCGGVITKGLAERLLVLQKGQCVCCGLSLKDGYHLDHIIPLFLGGSNTDDNMQLLRPSCNQQKSAKHPIDFMRSRGFLL